MGASDDDALLPTPLLQLRLTPEKWRQQVKTLNKIEVYYQPFQFEKKKKKEIVLMPRMLRTFALLPNH